MQVRLARGGRCPEWQASCPWPHNVGGQKQDDPLSKQHVCDRGCFKWSACTSTLVLNSSNLGS